MHIAAGGGSGVEYHLHVADVAQSGVNLRQREVGQRIGVGAVVVVHIHTAAVAAAVVAVVINVGIGGAVVRTV